MVTHGKRKRAEYVDGCDSLKPLFSNKLGHAIKDVLFDAVTRVDSQYIFISLWNRFQNWYLRSTLYNRFISILHQHFYFIFCTLPPHTCKEKEMNWEVLQTGFKINIICVLVGTNKDIFKNRALNIIVWWNLLHFITRRLRWCWCSIE